MNSKSDPVITVETLLTLRKENEAIRLITARLGVSEMGPADHIRTKHEVKQWLQSSGDLKEAGAIVERALARRTLHHTHEITQKMSQRLQRGQRLDHR